jgi:drug/metabolite transporter (DMT)-like permease
MAGVVVALMAARASGVAPRTWLAVALSVAGVGCLELPGVLGDAALSPCLGDLVAFGQPLGFGLSYVVLEKAMAEYPQDELPLAALQCAVIAAAAVCAASVGAHELPWQLPWAHMLPGAAESAAVGAAAGGHPWGVPMAIAYTGIISTALTIWLTAKVFKKLPSTDASIILASEPLWATGFAALLLHEPLVPSTAVGGMFILGALAANEGACDAVLNALPQSAAAAGGAREEAAR